MRGTESLIGHYRPKAPQAPEADRVIARCVHCALTRSAGSGFFVAFGEAHGSAGPGRWHGASPKAPQAPEADRVIARSGLIHSVLTARSDRFA